MRFGKTITLLVASVATTGAAILLLVVLMPVAAHAQSEDIIVMNCTYDAGLRVPTRLDLTERSIVADHGNSATPPIWKGVTTSVTDQTLAGTLYFGDTPVSWTFWIVIQVTIQRRLDHQAHQKIQNCMDYAADWTNSFEPTREICRQKLLLFLAYPWIFSLAASFVTAFREMRYLWRNPHRLDNTELVKVLGEEPHTRPLSKRSGRPFVISSASRGAYLQSALV